MTRANANFLISNEKEKIGGFLISPDFDTSQQMDIGNFIKNIYNRQIDVRMINYEFDKIEIPVLLMGTDIDCHIKSCSNYIKQYDYLFELNKNHSRNYNELKNPKTTLSCCNLKIDKFDYLVESKDMFFCFVYSSELLIFVLNPYKIIFNQDEVYHNKEYKTENCGIRLKGYQSIVQSYKYNIADRQIAYLKEMSYFFAKFERTFKINGPVVGECSMFLNHGFLIAAGTEWDSKTCLDRKIFPYKQENGTLTRRTEEEIDKIEEEQNEYNKKCEVVKKRLDVIEEMLKSQKKTYTIISKRDIKFNSDGNYEVWMNAQVSDGAHYGWFTEQDFIDWMNMSGPIPFKRERIRYFGTILEKYSNGNYKFLEIKYTDSNKKFSSYDDRDCVGVFQLWDNVITLNADEIENLIDLIEPLLKYSVNDIENALKSKQNFFNKLLKR